jgi:isoleucyl-tRNA synthetase
MQVDSGEVYIVAKELCENVAKAAGISHYNIIATLPGSALELMTAQHPLLDIDSVVLCGDHVTLEAGSGCVHTAPGFGADDFMICQKYDKAGLTNIGVPVPVNAKGVMTDERFAGNHISKANNVVLPALEEVGALLAKEDIIHSYPHCWRCKNPIIFRATEQWFCSVDAIKEAAVKSCDGISWKPDWGKERMTSMITERSDWCISRQRKWGVPIPIFYCDSCGTDIVTPETIDHIANLFHDHGSNIWFEKTADELVPQGFVCPKCGHTHFSKESDIMDVWFDSGSTHAAVVDQREELSFPADVYLEGGDQYRGWFQSSMLTSIAAKGVAPYKQIITHGWTVDGEGRAMHKSLGNAVAPDEVIKDYGADMLRLWVSSADYTQDMRISKDILKQLSQAYLKIRNTARYMLGNLSGFQPDGGQVAYEALAPLDQWALSRLNELVKTVRSAYERYEFHSVYRAIYNFCVVDMSNFYLDIIKDRLYCGDDADRAAAQTALYQILDGMTRMLAPMLAFTSEEIWAAMPHATGDDGSCVLLNDIPEYNEALCLSEEESARWEQVIALRSDVNKALENARAQKLVGKSLDAEITLYLNDEGQAAFAAMGQKDLAAICIVSKVTVVNGEGQGLAGESFPGVTVAVAPSVAPKCSRCWVHDVNVDPETELCPRCGEVFKKISL